MTFPPPPPPSVKKPIGKIVIIIAVVLVTVIAISLFVGVLLPLVNRPNPEVTLIDGHEGFSGFNYVYYVDVAVKNNGASGYVTVYGEINGAGRYEQQDSRIYLASGESKSLTFTFDISLLGTLGDSVIRYKAWANPS